MKQSWISALWKDKYNVGRQPIRETEAIETSPFRCPSCKFVFEPEVMGQQFFPRLDSMGSGVADIICPECKDVSSAFLRKTDKGQIIEHISIIGVPGPDYITRGRYVYPETTKFVWNLADRSNNKWFFDLKWDVYVFNWIGSGLTGLFSRLVQMEGASCPDPSNMKSFFPLWGVGYELDCFTQNRYQQVLKDIGIERELKIQFLENAADWSNPETVEIAFKRFQEAAADTMKTARTWYAGRTFNSEFMRASFPTLVFSLVKLAATLPPMTAYQMTVDENGQPGLEFKQ